jgi:hypothetical protein
MSSNLSPEEILKQKEMQSGIKFDDPEDLVTAETPSPELKNSEPQIQKDVIQQEQVIAKSSVTQQDSLLDQSEIRKALGGPSGWKNLPIALLPSKGIFYPEGTRIAIRSAEVKEIRHFSTIDDDDRLDIEEKLGFILDQCMIMEFPGDGVMNFNYLKSEDRFFVIMAIRDLTFTKGENMIVLYHEEKCTKESIECPIANGFELRTGVLSSYELDEKIMKYYSDSERCFVFKPKKINKEIRMWIPSIGVARRISEFVIYCSKNSIEIDDSFVQIAPFLFDDWKKINVDIILQKLKESDTWTKEEFSLCFELSEKIKIGTKGKARVSCPKCGAKEVTANITFPEGVRSLFVISDIFGELL